MQGRSPCPRLETVLSPHEGSDPPQCRARWPAGVWLKAAGAARVLLPGSTGRGTFVARHPSRSASDARRWRSNCSRSTWQHCPARFPAVAQVAKRLTRSHLEPRLFMRQRNNAIVVPLRAMNRAGVDMKAIGPEEPPRSPLYVAGGAHPEAAGAPRPVRARSPIAEGAIASRIEVDALPRCGGRARPSAREARSSTRSSAAPAPSADPFSRLRSSPLSCPDTPSGGDHAVSTRSEPEPSPRGPGCSGCAGESPWPSPRRSAIAQKVEELRRGSHVPARWEADAFCRGGQPHCWKRSSLARLRASRRQRGATEPGRRPRRRGWSASC